MARAVIVLSVCRREALKERRMVPLDVGVLVGEARHGRTTYRMAWEVVTRDEVVIWAYGPHEGFNKKLARRARQ
jgi:hypothetical protein